MGPAPDPRPWHKHPAVPITVGLALLATVAALHFTGAGGSAASQRAPLATAAATPTEAPPEPATPASSEPARPLTTSEIAFLKAMGSPPLVQDLLQDGRDVCGLDDGWAPSMAGILDARDMGGEDYALTKAAIRHLCPKYLPLLRKAQNAITEGTHEVGTDIKPGTYRTRKQMTDCYWERSTPGGSIISNGFVSNAPAGVVVTVHKGEGFTSRGCGYWTRVS